MRLKTKKNHREIGNNTIIIINSVEDDILFYSIEGVRGIFSAKIYNFIDCFDRQATIYLEDARF